MALDLPRIFLEADGARWLLPVHIFGPDLDAESPPSFETSFDSSPIRLFLEATRRQTCDWLHVDQKVTSTGHRHIQQPSSLRLLNGFVFRRIAGIHDDHLVEFKALDSMDGRDD